MPYEYGLSARGELVVERIYMGHHYREEFFYANDQRVVSFSYTYDFKELAWVRVTRVADGRVVLCTPGTPQDQIGRLEQRFDYAKGLRRSTVREVRCGQTGTMNTIWVRRRRCSDPASKHEIKAGGSPV